MLNVADLFHWIIIVFQHKPEHIDAFSQLDTSLKISSL
jgi:hypothetical protein